MHIDNNKNKNNENNIMNILKYDRGKSRIYCTHVKDRKKKKKC